MFIPNRRDFLRSIAAAGSGAFLGQRAAGLTAGEEREVDGVRLCWCPPGQFVMGSPAEEKDHRPDEAQVTVRLTRGFWTAKFEATQGQWKRIVGDFPGKPQTAEFGEGEDVPCRPRCS